jgi:hypothetical protein
MIDRLVYEDEGRAIVRCRNRACRRAAQLTYSTRTEQWAFNGRPASRSEVTVGGRTYSLGRYMTTQGALLKSLSSRTCEGCGGGRGHYDVNIVRGVVVEDKPCNAKCMGAVGPSCECSCGGKNHGGGHGVLS